VTVIGGRWGGWRVVRRRGSRRSPDRTRTERVSRIHLLWEKFFANVDGLPGQVRQRRVGGAGQWWISQPRRRRPAFCRLRSIAVAGVASTRSQASWILATCASKQSRKRRASALKVRRAG